MGVNSLFHHPHGDLTTGPIYAAVYPCPYAIIYIPQAPSHPCPRLWEVSELADEHDLGSCAERRGSSSLPFPTNPQRRLPYIRSDQMIEEFAKLVPESLLDKSGEVFYSGRRAFNASSDLYILGANPGGDPEALSDQTVSKKINEVLYEKPENWSAYRDEAWRGKAPGKSTMQRRMLHLFGRVGHDPGEVPVSEVVFQRSRNVNALKRRL